MYYVMCTKYTICTEEAVTSVCVLNAVGIKTLCLVEWVGFILKPDTLETYIVVWKINTYEGEFILLTQNSISARILNVNIVIFSY